MFRAKQIKHKTTFALYRLLEMNFLLGLLFDPEDVIDIFLQNVS
jgi:hypothetical protein